MPEPVAGITIPASLINHSTFASIEKSALGGAVFLTVEPGEYRVVSFSVTLVSDGVARKFECTGAELCEPVRMLVRSLEAGKVIFIENILIESPDGENAVIPSFGVRVK